MPYEYENILVAKIWNQIWKLEIVSFQMIHSLSILRKVFTKILLF